MKKQDTTHLIHQLSKADYVTLAAVGLIVVAFWLLATGHTYLAVGVAFMSMFLDYLDGVIARRYGGSAYGAAYDSLYDVLGWVLFPALVINMQAQWQWWAIIVTTCYCIAAVMRLGRFTVAGYVETVGKNYQGLPVLYSKYALIGAFFLQGIPAVVILIVMIPLMISSRLVPKQQAWLAWLEPVYALLFIGLAVTQASIW
jgi:archaetidylserine synthase